MWIDVTEARTNVPYEVKDASGKIWGYAIKYRDGKWMADNGMFSEQINVVSVWEGEPLTDTANWQYWASNEEYLTSKESDNDNDVGYLYH